MPCRTRTPAVPRALLPAAVLAFAALPLQAQVIDDVDVRREGEDAVVQLRFGTEVQFQRAVSTRSNDLTLVQYTLVGTTNAIVRATQGLRFGERFGLPAMQLADEPDTGERAERGRRVVIRFADPTAVTVRQGPRNRSIEIVLAGRGSAVTSGVPTPPPPLTAAPPAERPVAPVPAPLPPVAVLPPPPAPPTPSTSTEPAAPRPQAEVEREAAVLLAQAQNAFEQRADTVALARLTTLLDLPPNLSTPAAQELIGRVRLRMGDAARARIEFETYLKLYPDGPGAARVKRELAALAPPPAADATPGADTAPARDPRAPVVAGSASLFHYGGNGQLRSRDFQDSPVSGLPQQVGEATLSSDRTRQLYGDVDLSWRQRADGRDLRFVARDSYLRDFERPDKSRNRLSALYADYRALTDGWGVKLGRQSPTGGGVMGRYDGAQGYWMARPRFKLGAVAGQPVDPWFESKRRFAGVSADLELGRSAGVGVYAIGQTIDGVLDRRALGLEARFFDSGASVFGQFDYDNLFRKVNIASVTANLVLEDGTVFNLLADRRALQPLALGNALTFGDGTGTLYTRIGDRLAVTPVEVLREQVARITPYVTLGQVGMTKPLNPKWQLGASVQTTTVGAIPPLADVPGYEEGRPATGRVISITGQVIGLNLYSARDTHVLSTTAISSTALDAVVLSYNLSSLVAEVWLLEPSLQFYRDRNNAGGNQQRWTPGLRASWRGAKRWTVESALTYEIGRTDSTIAGDGTTPATTTRQSSTRVNYSLGARHDF